MFSFQQVGKIHLGGQFSLGDKYWQRSVKGNAGSAPAPTLVGLGFGPLPVAAGPPLPLCTLPCAGLQVLGTLTPGAKCSWPSSMVNTREIKSGEKKQRPDGRVRFFPFQPSGRRKGDYRRQKGMSFSSGCSHDSLGGCPPRNWRPHRGTEAVKSRVVQPGQGAPSSLKVDACVGGRRTIWGLCCVV